MLALHPQYIRSNDKRQFVVLPQEEFSAICELLEDVEDLRLLEEARAENAGHKGITLDQLKKELGIS